MGFSLAKMVKPAEYSTKKAVEKGADDEDGELFKVELALVEEKGSIVWNGLLGQQHDGRRP